MGRLVSDRNIDVLLSPEECENKTAWRSNRSWNRVFSSPKRTDRFFQLFLQLSTIKSAASCHAMAFSYPPPFYFDAGAIPSCPVGNEAGWSKGLGCSTIASSSACGPSTPRLRTAVLLMLEKVLLSKAFPIWHVNSRDAPEGNGPENWARLLTNGS